MTYDRDPKYAHPILVSALSDILKVIQGNLSVGTSCKLVSAHRTPADQFELFKKGRAFKDGKWVVIKKGEVVTDKDGFIKKSRHNYLPCTAIDIGLFDAQNKYIPDSPLYHFVAEAKQLGFEWGGDWTTLVDEPHLQIPVSLLFQKDLEKDNGVIWQQLLIQAGTYHGVVDGIFGPKSIKALEDATGEKERNIKAWDKLHSSHADFLSGLSTLQSRIAGDRPVPRPIPRPSPSPNTRPEPRPTPSRPKPN